MKTEETILLAHVSGQMLRRFIRLPAGDRLNLEMSPYNVDETLISYRL